MYLYICNEQCTYTKCIVYIFFTLNKHYIAATVESNYLQKKVLLINKIYWEKYKTQLSIKWNIAMHEIEILTCRYLCLIYDLLMMRNCQQHVYLVLCVSHFFHSLWSSVSKMCSGSMDVECVMQCTSSSNFNIFTNIFLP